VRDRLADCGITVVPQYGVGGYRVDFAAVHPEDPGRMVLAIEADGASYRESGSVRDRDRLRGEHLQRLGWRYHRLWSTSWFQNPDAEIAKLQAAYEDAVAGVRPAPKPEPSVSPPAGPAGSGAAGRVPAGQVAAGQGAAGPAAGGSRSWESPVQAAPEPAPARASAGSTASVAEAGQAHPATPATSATSAGRAEAVPAAGQARAVAASGRAFAVGSSGEARAIAGTGPALALPAAGGPEATADSQLAEIEAPRISADVRVVGGPQQEQLPEPVPGRVPERLADDQRRTYAEG
jgi:very-short-patch-repair endonuclease